MDIPDTLLCLFNAEIDEQNGSFVIEIPDNEITMGDVDPGQAYRVAILPPVSGAEPEPETGRGTGPDVNRGRTREISEPPVAEGDTVEVEVEDLGEQGDGIARIGPGYIVFVPDTNVGDRVTVEITKVHDNFAFGDVIEGPY